MYQLEVLQVTRVPRRGPEVTADPAPSSGTGHGCGLRRHLGIPNLPAQLFLLNPQQTCPLPMGSKLAKGPQQAPSRDRPPQCQATPHSPPHHKGLGTYHPEAALTTQLASQVTQRLWAYKSYAFTR